MSRLDQLNSRGLIERLKAAKREADGMKRRQFLGGDSIVIKNYQTLDTWDVTTVVSGASAEKKYRVDFTFDEAGVGYCEIEFKWSISLGASYNEVLAFDDPSASVSTSKKSFIVGLIPNNNLDPATLRLKFGIRSTRSGTLSWTAI